MELCSYLIEKAYDKVDWDFLQHNLCVKGFFKFRSVIGSRKWLARVTSLLPTQRKEIRQSDPLSPFLFDLIPDMIVTLISRDKYVDDSILFLQHDEAVNLKLVFNVFEQLSGVKINLHKSDVFLSGEAKTHKKEYYSNALSKIRNKDWVEIEEIFQKKLGSWKAELLSVGGRLVLINSGISSLPMFMLVNTKEEKEIIVTWSQASSILPAMVDHTIAIHNGKEHRVCGKKEV
ncbi:hypothetical protein U9M48_014083 [Paspalum notatum var. saurae]|uniref:Reverse transcriptase domain-containing protein n=1 Tax=Paspalum notatum var. saurae TaxID=547442 RepID=A0AAQ3WK67_PASNO